MTPDISHIRRKYFPFGTEDGFVFRPSSEAEIAKLHKTAFKVVFPPQDGSLHFTPRKRREKAREMKRRYSSLHHEWFLLLSPEGKPIGWHAGEAEDAVTFYMRNTGILPRYQGRGLYTRLLARLLDYLGEVGYERVTSQHKATNRRILIMKLRQGFDVAGLDSPRAGGLW